MVMLWTFLRCIRGFIWGALVGAMGGLLIVISMRLYWFSTFQEVFPLGSRALGAIIGGMIGGIYGAYLDITNSKSN